MATASPVVFDNWNGDYLNLLETLDTGNAAYQFTFDVTETINLLLESHNLLEARVAALEP